MSEMVGLGQLTRPTLPRSSIGKLEKPERDRCRAMKSR
jgi:hypothetical protein